MNGTDLVPSYDDHACAFLGLSQLKGIGFQTLREIGGVDAVAAAIEREGLSHLRTSTEEDPPSFQRLADLGYPLAEELRRKNVHLIRVGDPLYPAAFHELSDSLKPLWFFVRGDTGLLTRPSVGVVGTRTPSDDGKFLTQYAVSSLVPQSPPIVSGLARGVDELAHEWALASSIPTISVLGTGILRAYPASNATLADKIADSGGLLLSEYLPHEGPKGRNFVWRNRLQAALSAVVIAPEWKRASGTAHTIRYARKLNRPTVNLRLAGRTIDADSGAAGITFEVPTEQLEFTDYINWQLTRAAHSRRAEQTDLFGG